MFVQMCKQLRSYSVHGQVNPQRVVKLVEKLDKSLFLWVLQHMHTHNRHTTLLVIYYKGPDVQCQDNK